MNPVFSLLFIICMMLASVSAHACSCTSKLGFNDLLQEADLAVIAEHIHHPDAKADNWLQFPVYLKIKQIVKKADSATDSQGNMLKFDPGPVIELVRPSGNAQMCGPFIADATQGDFLVFLNVDESGLKLVDACHHATYPVKDGRIILSNSDNMPKTLGIDDIIKHQKIEANPYKDIKDQKACDNAGGTWIRSGFDGRVRHCVQATTDGGKSCLSSSECQGFCKPERLDPGISPHIPEKGTCSPVLQHYCLTMEHGKSVFEDICAAI